MADTTKINEEIDLIKTVDLAPQVAVQLLAPVCKEIIEALRSKYDSVPFEELYDKLIDHETYFRDLDSVSVYSTIEINATTAQPFSNNRAPSNYRPPSSNQRNSCGYQPRSRQSLDANDQPLDAAKQQPYLPIFSFSHPQPFMDVSPITSGLTSIALAQTNYSLSATTPQSLLAAISNSSVAFSSVARSSASFSYPSSAQFTFDSSSSNEQPADT
ncbi:hypothetical protein Adt_13454 [Abeliophyllum distichum]|uniref:Uncharacterized protein n=1 Tax=Abeliophyllum distichum TaxID=126358 RepID=A0ABD1TWW1_9LAMI